MPTDLAGNNLSLLAEPFWQIFGAITLSILPGWTLAARLKLDPLSKLLVAVIGSYTLMYLLEFGAYLLSTPQWLPLSLLFLCCMISAALERKREKNSDPDPFPWDGALTWAALAIWIMAMQSQIVVYGAVYWYGDWYEHYERSLFFLNQRPPETRFLEGGWPLAARGPTFNTDAALLMGLFGNDFWVYQGVATVFNTFPVLPLALLIRDMARMKQVPALLWSALILAIAPFAVQHEIFPWTKFFSVGFILGGIHLYRLGATNNRPWLTGWSFGAFAAGILAHYMALAFALFFAVHFLYLALKKHWAWPAVVYPPIACSALLATWFFYLIATFGLHATLTANSTLGKEYVKRLAWPGTEGLPWYKVFIGNMTNTLLPYSWRHEITGLGHAPRILQADPRAGPQFTPSLTELNRKTEWLADLVNNPSSLLGSLGWAGGLGLLMTVFLWIREQQKGPGRQKSESQSDPDTPRPQPGWRFWLIFFVLGIPLNVLPSPVYSPLGVAHINLQPFVCLAAVLVLRWLKEVPTTGKLMLLGLFLIESALTTGALIALQERLVPIVREPDGTLSVEGKLGLNPIYVSNYIYKLFKNVVFVSDRLGDLATPGSLVMAVAAILLIFFGLYGAFSAKEK